MKYLKRILIGLVALVVVAIVAVIVIASTVDLNSYKNTIAAEVEAATGRKVTISGKIEQNLLSSSPSIVLNEVAFSNATWGSRPSMITAKRVELAVDLLPLVSGTIKVRRFILVGADVLLETSAQGQRNWVLGSKAAGTTKSPTKSAPSSSSKSSGGGGAGLPRIAEIQIKGSTLTYRDGKTKLSSVIKINDVRMQADSRSSVIELRTSATYQDVPVTTEGRLGSVAAMTSGTKSYPIDLKVRFGESDVAVKLNADLSGPVPVLSGSITGKDLDIDKVTSTFGGQPKKGGGGGRMFGSDPLPLGFLHAAEGKIEVSLATLRAGGKRFTDVVGTIGLKAGKLSLDPIGLKTAGGEITGTFMLDSGTKKPRLAIALKGSKLSLSKVSGQSTVGSRMNLAINLTGVGTSLRQIASSARGPVVAVAGPGPINSSSLSFISTNLLQAIPLLGQQRRLALNCIVARFNFVNGIGSSSVLVIDTTRMTIAGRGTISLRSESIDLILVPTTKGKSLASVAALVPIRVRGPLTNPRASPDPAGVPKEVVGAIFNTIEMPVEFLGSILGRKSNRKASPCATAHGHASGARRTGGGSRKPGLIDRINPFKK